MKWHNQDLEDNELESQSCFSHAQTFKWERILVSAHLIPAKPTNKSEKNCDFWIPISATKQITFGTASSARNPQKPLPCNIGWAPVFLWIQVNLVLCSLTWFWRCLSVGFDIDCDDKSHRKDANWVEWTPHILLQNSTIAFAQMSPFPSHK